MLTINFGCPKFVALIGDSHVMGWGSKAIEIRAVENGQLDGVFMHKRTQKLRFLCERNDKVCVVVRCVHIGDRCLPGCRCSLPASARPAAVKCTSWPSTED